MTQEEKEQERRALNYEAKKRVQNRRKNRAYRERVIDKYLNHWYQKTGNTPPKWLRQYKFFDWMTPLSEKTVSENQPEMADASTQTPAVGQLSVVWSTLLTNNETIINMRRL